MPPKRTDSANAARFWSMVQQTPECWFWLGGVYAASGYGYFKVAGRQVKAHRYAYGPVPSGMTLDHECHNRDDSCPGGPTCPHRRCVNPAHLIPRTAVDNARRAASRRTACSRGHQFDTANTYLNPKTGQRCCRACRRDCSREFKRNLRRPTGIGTALSVQSRGG